MFGKKVILLAASILAMSLWGCSSDFDAENTPASGTGTTVVDNSSVGAANCIGCHSTRNPQVVADYLAGNHVIHSTRITAASDDCLGCHDPLGDGPSVEPFIAAGDIPLDGLAAVTCETCHGSGGNHVNGTPIPYITPDYNRC